MHDFPTLRTCLETLAGTIPSAMLTNPDHFGANRWEPGRLLAYCEQHEKEHAELDRPAVILEHALAQTDSLQEQSVASIHFVGADGKISEDGEFTVYPLFTLAGFCHYIEHHIPPDGCCVFTNEHDHPLLWYALEHFGLELELHEDPILLYYRPVNGLTWQPFPLWATLLHKMLSAIKSEQEEPKVDWRKTILALRPLIERLTLHTDWPYSD